ncbi:MAG: DUF2116 family Zn-ribbon domain-containing protein [Chloroflexi bacterium]|nr:DUF2116 family Zn-ribbon domain-containing protein [Chloroflexota bacterium]
MTERECVVCGGPITGRKDRKTCSNRCRTALNRAEKDAGTVTPAPRTVTTASGSVTYSWQADEPTDPLGHWMPIEEEGTPWY